LKKNTHPYKLIREVTPKECQWLDRVYPAGEIVYKYYGATYKCIGENGFAFCREADQTPFFELPNDAVALVK
jgi:hypothetical protein